MKVALILSATLNLALAGVLCLHLAGKGRVIAPSAGGGDVAPASGIGARIFAGPNAAQTQVEINSLPETNHTASIWASLESADVERFVTNLRVVGCPEPTIRDIITDRLESAYKIQCAISNLEPPFWAGRAERSAYTRLQKEFQNNLISEQERTLDKLLGSSFVGKGPRGSEELVSMALFSFLSGPGPDACTINKLMAVFGELERRSEALHEGAPAVAGPEEQAGLAALTDWMTTRLHELLTPEQLQEFELRCSAFKMTESGMQDVGVTPGEFRNMAAIYGKVFGTFEHDPIELLKEQSHKPQQDEEFRSRLKEYFGEVRYNDVQRRSDAAFKDLRNFADDQNLGERTAVAVYEIKQALEAEAKRQGDAAADPNVPRGPIRRSEVVENATLALAQVQRLMGESAFATYMARGQGAWLTNLASP